MTVIGTSPPRPDGFAKAAGGARYADDLDLPGTWFGATVRSPHPHARIEAIRFHPERAPDGAVCLTARNLPGPNGVQLLDDSWPVLADGVVRHVGEPVALVAAPARLDARRALAAVEVDYAPLEPVLGLEAAEKADAPPLAEIVLGVEADEVEAALAGADRVVEGTWRSGHQEHIYIECQAMTAWVDGDGVVTVDGTMQCPYYVHKALTHALELPPERVRVKVSAVGGGFGGKEDYPSLIALHAALLARATGRPVRIAYDRHEDIVGTTKRHPSLVRHRTGLGRDGRLVAMDVDLLLDGGAYATLSEVVLSRAVLHAAGPYRCPAVRVRGRALATNTATNGAFRGFGAPQAQFACERQMDRAARAVGLDPWSFRRLNCVEPGDELPTGQVLDDTAAAVECLERIEERTDFRRRWRELEAAREAGEVPRRGIGLSLYFHGAGFTGEGEARMRSPVTVRLDGDGRVEVATAMTDMGQGMATIYPQMAREASGLGEGDVVLLEPDTARVPDSGPTVASRTTMIVGATMAEATAELVGRVAAWWREREGIGEPLEARDGRLVAAGSESAEPGVPFGEAARLYLEEEGPLEVTRRHEPAPGPGFDETTYRGDAYPTYSWGADVAELEVDPDTYGTRPERLTVVCEIGRAIHPRLCVGQVEGGTLQAVGWALMEEVKVEGGRYLNDRLATYIIPTFEDSPELVVELLEKPFAGGPFGAKGVGELPMDGGAPAVVAALENATGLVLAEIPATPERLFAAAAAGRRLTGEGAGEGESGERPAREEGAA